MHGSAEDTSNLTLYTIRDAAKIVRQTTWTVRGWVSRGFVPVVRIGGRVFIRASDLRELVRHGCPKR